MWTSIILASVFICGHVFGMAESECCHVKIVGHYTYTLVNSSLPKPARCLNGCAYIRDDQLGGPYCFARGGLPVQCKDKDGYCLQPTVPPPTIKHCDGVVRVRKNVSEFTIITPEGNALSEEGEELNDLMKIIKGYPNSELYSFENIGNYHGAPHLCYDEQSKLNVSQFDCPATPDLNVNITPCCINHVFIPSWDEMFAPWHRLLTLQMELALIYSTNGTTKLGIPYWDWTSVNEIPSLALQGEWKYGPVKCEDRNTKRNVHPFPTQKLANRVKQSYKQRSTAEFNLFLAEPHIFVHDLVGGDMGNGPNTSAFDPVFYLHHSQIDYEYAFWQELQKLRENPVPFENYDWEMQPFREQPHGTRTINPFTMTLHNAKPPDGLDYEKKFCYKYDKLLFQGQTPQKFLENCKNELKNPSLYVGFTDKYSGIASRTNFTLIKGSTKIIEDIGPVSSFGGNNPLKRAENRDDLNQYLLEVTDLLASTNYTPLDKTLQFEVSEFVDFEDKPLDKNKTFKPTATYRKADTEHYVVRIHVDHIEDYSPVISHCHLSSSVEFLKSDGNYSDQVTLGSENIVGEFNITKMNNNFTITKYFLNNNFFYGQNYSITIGYYPGCHLQCGTDGLPKSEYPGVEVIPWNLNWIKCHNNMKEIQSIPRPISFGLGIPYVTVFIAWCQGAETDIVKIPSKEDFDNCTNFGDVITATSSGSVDGFIAIQHTDSGIYYFASRSQCTYGFKIAINITKGEWLGH